MITIHGNQSLDLGPIFANMYLVCVVTLFLLNPANLFSQESPVSLADTLNKRTKIAYTSKKDGNFDIYVMNADGSKQIRLTNNPAYDGFPPW